jgi:hypothetical protein
LEGRIDCSHCFHLTFGERVFSYRYVCCHCGMRAYRMSFDDSHAAPWVGGSHGPHRPTPDRGWDRAREGLLAGLADYGWRHVAERGPGSYEDYPWGPALR